MADAGPQLSRRRIREGHDQQFVRVDGGFRVGDEPDGPLGQDGGLAAARRRADQQRPAPVVDGGLLGACPFGSTHGYSSFFSVSSGASKGLAGASSARSPMPLSWQQMKP